MVFEQLLVEIDKRLNSTVPPILTGWDVDRKLPFELTYANDEITAVIVHLLHRSVDQQGDERQLVDQALHQIGQLQRQTDAVQSALHTIQQQRIERGVTPPSQYQVLSLARLGGLDPNVLFRTLDAKTIARVVEQQETVTRIRYEDGTNGRMVREDYVYVLIEPAGDGDGHAAA